MTIFSELKHLGEEAVAKLEGLFAPIAESALKAGVADLTGDAAQVAAKVAADPTLATDAAKREAATKALGEKIAAQGATLGENTVAAAAAAALAALPAQPSVKPVTLPQSAA